MLAYRIAEVFGVTVEELCCLKENRELEDKDQEANYQCEKFRFGDRGSDYGNCSAWLECDRFLLRLYSIKY